jgi:hypothetical protein
MFGEYGVWRGPPSVHGARLFRHIRIAKKFCGRKKGTKTVNADINIVKVQELSEAIRIGYRQCLRDKGDLPRCISQREAERMYGGALLNRWRKAGLIEPAKTGDGRNNMVLYDAQRLDVLYASTITPKRING